MPTKTRALTLASILGIDPLNASIIEIAYIASQLRVPSSDIAAAFSE